MLYQNWPGLAGCSDEAGASSSAVRMRAMSAQVASGSDATFRMSGSAATFLENVQAARTTCVCFSVPFVRAALTQYRSSQTLVSLTLLPLRSVRFRPAGERRPGHFQSTRIRRKRRCMPGRACMALVVSGVWSPLPCQPAACVDSPHGCSPQFATPKLGFLGRGHPSGRFFGRQREQTTLTRKPDCQRASAMNRRRENRPRGKSDHGYWLVHSAALFRAHARAISALDWWLAAASPPRNEEA